MEQVCNAQVLTGGLLFVFLISPPPNDYTSFFPLQALKKTNIASIITVVELGCKF